MDASAIQSIADLAIIKSENSVLESHVSIVPKSAELKSLEPFDSVPRHFRAHFKTVVLADFVKYINEHATTQTAVFIDKNQASADAIIDMGSPENPLWGKHRASIALEQTPAYAALLANNNRELSQQDFIDFLEDWAGPITFFYGTPQDTDGLPFAKVIGTLRKLKVFANSEKEQTVGNFSASASALESIEIKAGNIEIPTGFNFTLIPHDDFEPVNFVCQIRSISNDKAVKLKYRVYQLESEQEAIASAFRHKLQAGIATDEVNVYLGTISYQANLN